MYQHNRLLRAPKGPTRGRWIGVGSGVMQQGGRPAAERHGLAIGLGQHSVWWLHGSAQNQVFPSPHSIPMSSPPPLGWGSLGVSCVLVLGYDGVVVGVDHRGQVFLYMVGGGGHGFSRVGGSGTEWHLCRCTGRT